MLLVTSPVKLIAVELANRLADPVTLPATCPEKVPKNVSAEISFAKIDLYLLFVLPKSKELVIEGVILLDVICPVTFIP